MLINGESAARFGKRTLNFRDDRVADYTWPVRLAFESNRGSEMGFTSFTAPHGAHFNVMETDARSFRFGNQGANAFVRVYEVVAPFRDRAFRVSFFESRHGTLHQGDRPLDWYCTPPRQSCKDEGPCLSAPSP